MSSMGSVPRLGRLQSIVLPLAFAIAMTTGCTAPISAEPPQPQPVADVDATAGGATAPVPASSEGPGAPTKAVPAHFDVTPPSAKESRGLERLLLPARGTPVPAFSATTTSGDTLDSSTLASREPFVMVFFTSWCPVCERKMGVLRAALDGAGAKILTIGVAMDDEDTFGNVPAYAKRHGIPFRVVEGQTSPDLVEALDPKGSFPIIYIVGKDGRIIDVQLGIKPDHGKRLEQALRAALAGSNGLSSSD